MLGLTKHSLEQVGASPLSVIVTLLAVVLLMLAFTVVLLLSPLLPLVMAFILLGLGLPAFKIKHAEALVD